MPNESIYYVDYIYDGANVRSEDILDIASLDSLWGKDMDEPFIAIRNLKVTQDMLKLMSPDKNPTMKITLPNKISLIKFGVSEDEYNNFYSDGFLLIDIVGRCNINEWNGNIIPQIMIEDYNILSVNKYVF